MVNMFNLVFTLAGLEADESLLLLAAGFDPMNSLQDIEAFAISVEKIQQRALPRCVSLNLQSLPIMVRSATGGVLNSNTPLVCGGLLAGQSQDKCYQLGASTTHIASMKQRRGGAASVVIYHGTTLWVTGGLGSIYPVKTSELINLSAVADGVDIPLPTAFHCLERVNHMTILYGGYTATEDSNKILKSSWIIDMSETSPQWTTEAPMAVAREMAGCGTIKQDIGADGLLAEKFVVAAGGQNGFSDGLNILNRVEFLSVGPNNSGIGVWEEGPPLPFSLTEPGAATTEDQSILFLVGGMKVLDGQFSSQTLSLVCVQSYCKWSQLNQELLSGRVSTVTLVLPAKRPESVDYSPFYGAAGGRVVSCNWQFLNLILLLNCSYLHLGQRWVV